jgi:catechol 2,3-dioxygenase-like lactoylglutathione lyase family enzyme
MSTVSCRTQTILIVRRKNVGVTAPSSSPTRGPWPAAERVAKVSLRVRDLDASSGFYSRVLGCFESEANATGRVLRFRLAPLRSREGDVIELISGRPSGATPALDSFSIEVPTREDVDMVYRNAVVDGIRALAPHCTDDVRRCVVFDPDGHKIEVFSRMHQDAGHDSTGRQSE